MYEQKYPEVDDVVMVQVKSIAEMGAYVSLLEYNDIEGMILLSELSRRRIRSITKLIKVGIAALLAHDAGRHWWNIDITFCRVLLVCTHICTGAHDNSRRCRPVPRWPALAGLVCCTRFTRNAAPAGWQTRAGHGIASG